MTINIIHVASFSGNIGDVANHEGFYHQFKQLFSEEITVKKLEIRKFYKRWNEQKFDMEFANYVNQFDLFIIGGGNFFELCWDYSATGTTIDISLEVLQSIQIPIFINGIGVDDNKGITPSNILKFKTFLNGLFEKDNVFFTVRNDGSLQVIQKYFKEFADFIHKIPDHGFFLHETDYMSAFQPLNRHNIGFNIALDMSNIRYQHIGYERFLEIMSRQINRLLLETDNNIYLFPHIQSDYIALLDLMKLLKDEYVRTRVSITPIIQGRELDTFKYYQDCKFIFGMRFHANVCAISLGVPTLGLISYPKHGYLYDEIGMPDRKTDINHGNFTATLENNVDRLIHDDDFTVMLRKNYLQKMQEIKEEKENTYRHLKSWIKKHL